VAKAKGLRKSKSEKEEELKSQEEVAEEVVEDHAKTTAKQTEIEEEVAKETGDQTDPAALAEVGVRVSAAADEADAKKVAKELNVPEIKPATGKQANVRVKAKQDIRTYVGDQWFNLKAGETATVPANVKEILRKAGLLDTL
jgi:hypothetical protein